MSSENLDPVEGDAKVKSVLPFKGNRIPLPLILIYMTFFAWLIYYVATYMVPALPE